MLNDDKGSSVEARRGEEGRSGKADMRQRRPIAGLDALKVIAITLIVFHHYQQVFWCSLGPVEFYGGPFYFGYLVELFFMVSGFLALYTLRGRPAGGYRRLLARRLLRIFPIVTIALIYATLTRAMLGDIPYERLGAREALANLLLMFRGWPSLEMMGINNPTWYLCVLIQCYALFYASQWLCDRLGPGVGRGAGTVATSLAAIALAVLLFYRVPVIGQDAFRGYECFFMGVLVCLLVETIWDRDLLPGRLGSAAGAVSLALSAHGRRAASYQRDSYHVYKDLSHHGSVCFIRMALRMADVRVHREAY